MTAEQEDQMAAAAASRRLRASHTDREHVIDVLKAAFVQGLVTKDEFDVRVGQTFVSRTYAELAAVTADLPAGLIGGRPPRKATRARARPPMSHSDKARRCMVIAVALMTVAMFVPSGPAVGLFAPLCFAACVIAGAQILASRCEKRSRGQLPGGCQHLLRQRDAGKDGTRHHVRPSALLTTLDERRGIMRTAPLAVPERVACRIVGGPEYAREGSQLMQSQVSGSSGEGEGWPARRLRTCTPRGVAAVVLV